VTLTYARRKLETDYWMGTGLTGEPTAVDVLGSLLLDASIGGQSFEDYCQEFGADEDSRSEYRAWEACRDIGPRLRKFLGNDFDTFAIAERD
jgi:hypothetical protein